MNKKEDILAIVEKVNAAGSLIKEAKELAKKHGIKFRGDGYGVLETPEIIKAGLCPKELEDKNKDIFMTGFWLNSDLCIDDDGNYLG